MLIVRTKFKFLTQKVDGLTQKAQNNEFIESGSKNWALMNQTTDKVGLDDKKMKIDEFKLKKIILGLVRRDQFLYIDFQI